MALKEGLTQEVPMREMMMELAQQGSAQAESSTVPISGRSARVEVVAADVLPGAEGIRANEAEPRLEDATGGDGSAPGSTRGLY
jgi:hypothetical protein